MNRHQSPIRVAALLFVLAAAGARAQELELKEADIRKLIPVLRAAASDLGAAKALYEREEAARTSFSGDPLELFRERAKLDLPPGLRYVPGCSRAASFRGPVAIFTFGRDIDCYDRAYRDVWRGVKRGPDEQLPAEPDISPACHAEHEKTVKLVGDTQRFLEERGFQFTGTGPGGQPLYLDSPDRLFRMVLERRNTYDKAEPPETHPFFRFIEDQGAREAALEVCSDMPSGPIVVATPGDRFFERKPLDTLAVALRKAGLSEERFQALQTALVLARLDAKPDILQAAQAEAGDDPAALRALAIRRANAELYRRFAAELDPLLDALVPKE